MGIEAEGTVTVGGQKVPVQADFGSDHVTFSGGRRGQVKYSQVEVVGTSRGRLRLRVDGAPMEFVLGARADRIAQKIRKPPSRAEKLGLKAGMRVDADGIDDRGFLQELERLAQARAGKGDDGDDDGDDAGRSQGADGSEDADRSEDAEGSAAAQGSEDAQERDDAQDVGLDALFIGVRAVEDLDGLARHAQRLQPEGALWVVYPKGRREVREADVLQAGRDAGLKDVKVVRFSDRDTALKFVLPLADRPRRR